MFVFNKCCFFHISLDKKRIRCLTSFIIATFHLNILIIDLS